jgi:hypothetical protein
LAVRTHDNRVFTGTGGWGENGSHGGETGSPYHPIVIEARPR